MLLFNRLLPLATMAAMCTLASAADFQITPSSDGSLYVCEGCNVVSDGDYVMASGYVQGAVKFPTAALAGAGKIKKATLVLNAYGLPLWDLTVDIYGYGTAQGALEVADANAGKLLGTLIIPAGAGYGQPLPFDVTALLRKVKTPYVAFNLRTDSGTDLFSSLEYNYGSPSVLIVKTANPPASGPVGEAAARLGAADQATSH